MATILVIDDDPQVCDVLQQVLVQEGHHVYSAFNGVEGIIQYRAHRPDLVFVDILMPEKEGLETILDLRREFPNVVTIAMSGGSERAKINLLDMARRLGAQHTLIKPFSLDTVRELVHAALAE